MQADLIIVGAGMVGSTLALALEGSGLDILVLDASPLEAADFDPQGGFEPRVSALSAASQRIFERLGAWPGMSARRVSPYTDMHVWDGSGTGQIHFSAETVHAEVLGHIVENRVVQDALLETMQRRGGQRLLGAARLERLKRTPQGWQLTLDDGRQLNAPLLVAADGAKPRRCAGWLAAKRANGTICIRPSSPVCAAASRISGLPGNASPTTARWRFCRWSVMATSTGAPSSGRLPS